VSIAKASRRAAIPIAHQPRPATNPTTAAGDQLRSGGSAHQPTREANDGGHRSRTPPRPAEPRAPTRSAAETPWWAVADGSWQSHAHANVRNLTSGPCTLQRLSARRWRSDFIDGWTSSHRHLYKYETDADARGSGQHQELAVRLRRVGEPAPHRDHHIGPAGTKTTPPIAEIGGASKTLTTRNGSALLRDRPRISNNHRAAICCNRDAVPIQAC